MSWDRIKDAFFRAARGASPRVEYYRPFYGRVVSQSGNMVDVVPDDPLMPPGGLTAVPLRHGVPGLEVTVAPGTSVLIGYENGDPARAFAALWQGGETVIKLVFNGTLVVVGGGANPEPPIKGVTFNAALAAFLTAAATGAGASSLPQVAAAVNAIAGAAATLATALPSTLATNSAVT